MSNKLSIIEWLKVTYDEIVLAIQYYFAKKWLNNNFGYQEFWGNRIEDLEELEDGLINKSN